ncbi:MAG: reverse transcriptase domain-containing protein [Nanoarchaeota archaeon]
MYNKIHSYENLLLAFNRAKKKKNKRRYVKRFKTDLENNLLKIQNELINKSYCPCIQKTFILRDPKTRKITKSAFRDRVVHHALCNIIVPVIEKSFIYDSYANQIGKGAHKALKRFDEFKRKVSKNNTRVCYILKADIKHYFEEINHDILLDIIKKKIKDENVVWLIETILKNASRGGGGEALLYAKKACLLEI